MKKKLGLLSLISVFALTGCFGSDTVEVETSDLDYLTDATNYEILYGQKYDGTFFTLEIESNDTKSVTIYNGITKLIGTDGNEEYYQATDTGFNKYLVFNGEEAEVEEIETMEDYLSNNDVYDLFSAIDSCSGMETITEGTVEFERCSFDVDSDLLNNTFFTLSSALVNSDNVDDVKGYLYYRDDAIVRVEYDITSIVNDYYIGITLDGQETTTEYNSYTLFVDITNFANVQEIYLPGEEPEFEEAE